MQQGHQLLERQQPRMGYKGQQQQQLVNNRVQPLWLLERHPQLMLQDNHLFLVKHR